MASSQPPWAALGEAGLWLGLAGLAYGLTLEFDEPLIVYRFGAAAWPRVLIALIGVVALGQLASSAGWFRAGIPAASQASVDTRAGAAPLGRPGAGKRLATFLLPLAYLALLPRSGFYLTTPVFLAAHMALLGERRWTRLVLVPLAIHGLVLLVFARLFYVPLPTGNWPGFYDVSHWLLSLIR